jgi:Sec-independent protein translocase protein TatA
MKLLLLLGNFSSEELAIIVLLITVLFGGKKLPGWMKDLKNLKDDIDKMKRT